jgi:hypothetical protein
MARRCTCRSKCLHWVPNSVPLLADERLLALEPVMAILTDAADMFDADSLQFDADCQVHGLRPEPHAECCCQGVPLSASEFIAALGVDVRSAVRGARHAEVAGRPGRRSAAERRSTLTMAG